MAWTELGFGKHKGKTLPQVVFADPDWFFWAIEENVFKGSLTRESRRIHERARSIRIPPEKGDDLVAEYVIHSPTMKFGGVKLVERDRAKHVGSSPTFRLPCLDLGVVRDIAQYDKTGGKLLVKDLKHILFGTTKARLTRERCERFFDDDDKFVL